MPTCSSSERREQVLFKGFLRIPRHLSAMARQVERYLETHIALAHGAQQPFVFPAAGEVIGQVANVLAGKNEGEGAFDLFGTRRTHLPLKRLVAAQEAVGVIDPVAGLKRLIVRRPIGEQRDAPGRNTGAGFQ